MPKVGSTGEIIVLEPHPDDAFLSLGWHLEKLWARYPRRIVAVYANSARAEEGAEYARAIGASYECLGLVESKMGSGGPVTVPEALKRFLGALRGYSRLVVPLGLQHPDHLRVVKASLGLENIYYYLDTPYLAKQKLGECLQELTEGRAIESICFPHANKWKHIRHFKSQGTFFHYNPFPSWRLPEIVLR